LLQVTERSAAAHRPCERQLSPERDRKSRGARPGRKGPKGDKGEKGDQGIPGPFPDRNLAPGKTIRDTFAIEITATGGGQGGKSAMSYGFTLAAAPTPHLLNPVLGAPSTADCSGTNQNPQAAAGPLCAYLSVLSNVCVASARTGLRTTRSRWARQDAPRRRRPTSQGPMTIRC
jgi:hypothetical protein